MRTSIYGLTLILVAVLAAGCGSSSNGIGSGVTAPTPSPSATSTLTSTGGGATLVVQKTQFDNYLGTVSNAPTNIQVSVSLSQIGTYTNPAGGADNVSYGGQVTISYTDSSQNFADSFSSSLQSGSNIISSETQNNEYNLLSSSYGNMAGRVGYHGFFQGVTYCISNTGGTYALPPGEVCYGQVFGGAIILVLNQLGFNADGAGATTGSGTVWFKNFFEDTGIGEYLPGTNCWFVSAGPFQCREWLSGSGVNTLKQITPDGSGGYQQLGTFSGLDLTSSFNGTLN